MRKALVLGLVVLAGCDRTATVQVEDSKQTATADATASSVDELRQTTPASPTESPTFTATVPKSAAPRNWKFQALGTEPFWSVVTQENMVAYSTPEHPEKKFITAKSSWDSEGVVNAVTGKMTLSWAGKLGSEAFRLEIAPGKCSDGMSDVVYSYTAKLTIGTEVRSGCAKAG